MRIFGALVVLLWAAPVAAQPTRADGPGNPPAKTPADAVAHGTHAGHGDSRGPGNADGRGRGEELEDDLAIEAVEPDDELLGFDVGGGVRFVPRLQYRVRYYHDDGFDYREGGTHDFVRHRARLGLEARYQDWLSAVVNLQDVRTWGEEQHPSNDFSADGFDAHEAYMRFATPSESVSLTAGRQELGYLDGRLIERGDFGDTGRSFDAVRLVGQRGGATVDGAWALLRDYETNDTGEGPVFGKAHLGVLHLGYELHRAFNPNVLVIYEANTTTHLSRVTAGALLQGKIGEELRLDWSASAYVQAGGEDPAPAAEPVSYYAQAFTVETRATWDRSPKPYVALEGTFISGDENLNDQTLETFTTPYPPGHRHYGELDVFTVFPRDTQERGLRDFGAAIGVTPRNTDMRIAFHLFDGNVDRDDLRHFGWEMDFIMNGRYAEDHLGVGAVYGFFVPGEIIAAQFPEPEIEQRAFVTLDAKF